MIHEFMQRYKMIEENNLQTIILGYMTNEVATNVSEQITKFKKKLYLYFMKIKTKL